ncbi:peroxynitrite isomerase [Mycobacterium sp.]|uniref:peroxynitrite isomerase n=1 Tax=Mycobacterium sp. TaxID=1785 RepID=UPI0031D36557
MPPDLHLNLQALEPLLGTWQGPGSGEYPTIEPFDYLEEVTFSHVGKPFLIYRQTTKSVLDGLPLHAETGYLRVPRHNEVELVLAHPSGVTEIEVGSYVAEGTTVELAMTTSHVGLTPTAKEVTSLARRFRLDGDELTYSVQMGAVGQPLQHHLSAVLHRKP